MPNVSSAFKFILYTDDSMLILNISQTKYMIFHPYQKDIKNLTLILSTNSWHHHRIGRTIKLSRSNIRRLYKLETK